MLVQLLFGSTALVYAAACTFYLVFLARRFIPDRQTITTLTSQGGGAFREYATELQVRTADRVSFTGRVGRAARKRAGQRPPELRTSLA